MEFCNPPIRTLNFCLLVFKVIALLAVCKQTQKPKDTVTLGIITPEELCVSESLYPSEQGIGVIRSEGQSPAWDFSQPQLDGAGDW